MILILTNDQDEHADLVCEHLDSHGQTYIRFHPERFPTEVRVSLYPGGETFIDDGNRAWKLSDIHSVWYRRPNLSKPAPEYFGVAAEFAVKESQYLLRALYRGLEHCKWLNTPEQIARADCKPEQLTIAQKLGLRVPKSLITTNPTEALDFFDSCPDRVIYKQLSGFFQVNPEDGKGYSVYTNLLTRNDLIHRSSSIRFAPCLFQEYIEKSTELRITIIGEQVFAAEIDSQASERSKIDWRHYDFENTPYRATELPEDIRVKLLELMAHYKLAFGCIDMVITPNGDYVFLELNPNGQWHWIEALTGIPIAKHIAAYLGSQT